MQLTGAYQHVNPELPAIAESALAKVGAQHAVIVATGDFDRTVRSLLGNDSYLGDRSSGLVAAKTFIEPAATIVLNLAALSHLTDDEVERTIAHEACHVLMYDRREDPHWHHDLASSQVEYDMIAMGSGTIEEFRCELTVVRELGYSSAPNTSTEHLSVNLHNTNVDFLTAVSDPSSDDVEFLLARVTSVASALSKTLAVTAAGAADLHGDLSLIDLGAGSDDWTDYAQPTWHRRLELFGRLPGAGEPLEPLAFRNVLLQAAELEQASLLAMGFAFEVDDEEVYFRRVASNDHLRARMARAVVRNNDLGG